MGVRNINLQRERFIALKKSYEFKMEDIIANMLRLHKKFGYSFPIDNFIEVVSIEFENFCAKLLVDAQNESSHLMKITS